MKVQEIQVKVFLKQDIEFSKVPEKIAKFISMYLARDEGFLKLHMSKGYKPYSLDYLYPMEKDLIYKKENIYTFRIRSIDTKLVNYFLNGLDDFSNDDFKGLVLKARTIPHRHITRLYSLTPIIFKNDGGYWKGVMELDEYENRLNSNLFKKYKSFVGDIEQEDKFYKSIKFLNEKPIAIKYKGVELLGDKLELEIKDDKLSQDLAYLALGVTFSEGSSFSCGFMGYKFL